MRVIDLLKDVMKEDLSNLQIDTPREGYTLVSGLCFEYVIANEFTTFVNLDGETKILRINSKNSRGFYSIGIGTTKIKGWLSFPLNSHLISLDLQDFSNIDQDESYLVLKYGKSILDEMKD